ATHSEARAQFRFLRLMPLEGEQEYPPSTLLECRRTRAGAETARYLEMKAGESLVFLRRLLFFKGEPTVIDEISLPGSIFKGLSAAKFNEYKGSMYNLFETEFGTRMLRAEERISALAADADAAKLLEVAPGTPLLCVDRVSFTYGDKPVEVRRGLYRTDRHYYKNVLS
ncbi:MAG: UTRA domain-containing protein, partial [Proteobacteria bacterium]|nr:UTRA domain-containing protein [Pseudomonadota bacterium]